MVNPALTRLFGSLGDDAKIFHEDKVTYESHGNGYDPSQFTTDKGIHETFYPIGTHLDTQGRPFV